MTCIAAYRHEDKTWIACDTQATEEDGFACNCGTKLINKKNYAIGVARSIRVRDIISEGRGFPKHVKDISHVRKIRDTIKQLLIEDGACAYYSGDDNALIHPFEAIVASKYGIWQIYCDYSIVEHKDKAAIGSGRELALGALLTYDQMIYWVEKYPALRRDILMVWGTLGKMAVEGAVDCAAAYMSSVGDDIEVLVF